MPSFYFCGLRVALSLSLAVQSNKVRTSIEKECTRISLNSAMFRHALPTGIDDYSHILFKDWRCLSARRLFLLRVIIFSYHDNLPSPYRSRCDCRAQARERPALAPCWIGLAGIDACGHCDALSRLIEALHLDVDSRIIHALVLKVNALQPHDLAFWLRRA